MNKVRVTGKSGLIMLAVTSLALGGALLWASQSWYAFVWASAKMGFQQERVRIVMVNEAPATPKQYGLPDDLAHNIALRALIVNSRNQVVATAGREGFLENFPPANSPAFDIIQLRLTGWRDGCRVGGWALLSLGFLQALCLVCYLASPTSRT